MIESGEDNVTVPNEQWLDTGWYMPRSRNDMKHYKGMDSTTFTKCVLQEDMASLSRGDFKALMSYIRRNEKRIKKMDWGPVRLNTLAGIVWKAQGIDRSTSEDRKLLYRLFGTYDPCKTP